MNLEKYSLHGLRPNIYIGGPLGPPNTGMVVILGCQGGPKGHLCGPKGLPQYLYISINFFDLTEIGKHCIFNTI